MHHYVSAMPWRYGWVNSWLHRTKNPELSFHRAGVECLGNLASSGLNIPSSLLWGLSWENQNIGRVGSKGREPEPWVIGKPRSQGQDKAHGARKPGGKLWSECWEEREVTRCRWDHMKESQSGLEPRSSFSGSRLHGAVTEDPKPVLKIYRAGGLFSRADSGLSLVDVPRLRMHKARSVH